MIQGTGDREADVEAIAAGPSRFPFRALRRGLETVIEDAATAAPVARFPVPLDHISTFPNGRAWVGTSANHLYIINLEDSSKVKVESGKPEGKRVLRTRSKVQGRMRPPEGGTPNGNAERSGSGLRTLPACVPAPVTFASNQSHCGHWKPEGASSMV